MRLIELELLSKYKSLNPFKHTFPKSLSNKNVSPLCFAGINGSGKSHMMELVAEIFCYLERVNIGYASINQKMKESDLEFRIEYEILYERKIHHISVKKTSKSKADFYIINEKGGITLIDKPEICLRLLPERIIGYSSGMNEMLRYSFLKTQAFYSEDILNSARDRQTVNVPHTRTLYMNYECNAAIVLSIFIFYGAKKVFKNYLRIKGIDSFRITIQFDKKKPVFTTAEIDEIVDKLRKCATLHDSETGKRNYIFDYKLDETIKKRFKEYFHSAEELFVSLYKLYLLNPIILTKQNRKFYMNIDINNKKMSHTPPEVSPEDKVFKIDQIRFNLNQPNISIDYAGISDGEHQFLQVIGTILLFNKNNCLFLLDEPETHLNPTWRANFIQIIDDIVKNKNHQFVISTHSPFLVADCRGKDVLFFERPDEDKSRVRFQQVDFETYGCSYDYMLCKLFNMKSLLPERVFGEMKELVKSKDINHIKNKAMEFGESFEKKYIYQRIAELESKKKK